LVTVFPSGGTCRRPSHQPASYGSDTAASLPNEREPNKRTAQGRGCALRLTASACGVRLVFVRRSVGRGLWAVGLVAAIGGFIPCQGRGQPGSAADGVVVMSVGRAGSSSFRAGLWTSKLDGSNPRELTGVPLRGERFDRDVALSPDGSQVAFVRDGSGGNALF